MRGALRVLFDKKASLFWLAFLSCGGLLERTISVARAVPASPVLAWRSGAHGRSRFAMLRLNTGDGDDANDVFGRAAAGEIVHRGCDALGDGAVSFGLRESLNKLVTDIARIYIGEDEHVRLSCDGGARRFRRSDGIDDGGVELHLAVEEYLRCELVGDFAGVDDLARIVVSRRPFRRMRQQRT